PVAMQLTEVAHKVLDVIPRLRPIRVPTDPHRVPRAQLRVQLFEQRAVLALKLSDLFRIGSFRGLNTLNAQRGTRDARTLLRLADPLLELDQRLLEIQCVKRSHSCSVCIRPAGGSAFVSLRAHTPRRS